MLNLIPTLTDVFSTWHIARGSGLTAYVLLFFVTAGGLALSLQLVPAKARAFILGIHRMAAVGVVIFLVLHGMILFFDKHVAFSFADVWVPFWAAHDTLEIATGIVAFYTIAALVFTSFRSIMKAVGYENWRFTHYLSFPCYWLALYHGMVLGTDSGDTFIRILYHGTASIVISLTLLRIWKSIRKKVVANEHSSC